MKVISIIFVIFVIALIQSRVESGVLYCKSGVDEGKACSQEDPCLYKEAWQKVNAELNIIQLMDGDYDEDGSVDVNGIDGLVTVMGSQQVKVASLPTLHPVRDGFQVKFQGMTLNNLKQPLIQNKDGKSDLIIQLNQVTATGGQWAVGQLKKFKTLTFSASQFSGFKNSPLILGSVIPGYWEKDQSLVIEGSNFAEYSGIYTYEISTVQVSNSHFLKSDQSCLKIFGGDATFTTVEMKECQDLRPVTGTYENLQPDGRGGAIYFSQTNQKPLSVIRVVDSVFADNHAVFGGALFLNFMNQAEHSLKIEGNTQITNNLAQYGGGIFFWGNVPVTIPDKMISKNELVKDLPGYGADCASNAQTISIDKEKKKISVSPNQSFKIQGTIQDAFQNQIPIGRKDLFESLQVKSLNPANFKVHTIPIFSDINDFSFLMEDIEVIGQLESNGTVAILTHVASFRGEVVERIYVAQGEVEVSIAPCRVGWDLKKLDPEIGQDFYKCKLHPIPTWIYAISFAIGCIALFLGFIGQVVISGRLNLMRLIRKKRPVETVYEEF